MIDWFGTDWLYWAGIATTVYLAVVALLLVAAIGLCLFMAARCWLSGR